MKRFLLLSLYYLQQVTEDPSKLSVEDFAKLLEAAKLIKEVSENYA